MSTNDLAEEIELAIENESPATSVDDVSGRRCSNDIHDGIEYTISGDFIEIRPIIELLSERPYIIAEFNVAFDKEEPSVALFVVSTDEARQSKLTENVWT